MPRSVLRAIAGTDRRQPEPKGPFPAPESYPSVSCGERSARPGEVKIGRLRDAVPVTGLAWNFSPMPRIVPPPLGREMAGMGAAPRSRGVSLSPFDVVGRADICGLTFCSTELAGTT